MSSEASGEAGMKRALLGREFRSQAQRRGVSICDVRVGVPGGTPSIGVSVWASSEEQPLGGSTQAALSQPPRGRARRSPAL